MEKKSPVRRKKSADLDIQKRSMEAVPRWALALCAVILVLSFAIRQIGLDITTPLNRIMSAHAVRIETQAANMDTEGYVESHFEGDELHTLEKEINDLKKRVKKLERWSHSPGTSN